MATDLERLVTYGQERGWRVRIHAPLPTLPIHLEATPAKWYGVWGQASLVVGCPRAEVARIKGSDPALMVTVLAHELGHCEQLELVGRALFKTDEPLDETIEIELDAWHRGCRMLAELDIPLTVAGAEHALNAYATYAGNERAVEELLPTINNSVMVAAQDTTRGKGLVPWLRFARARTWLRDWPHDRQRGTRQKSQPSRGRGPSGSASSVPAQVPPSTGS